MNTAEAYHVGEVLTGRLAIWNADVGFGFLAIPERGQRLFVHVKAFRVPLVRVGDWFTVTVGRDPAGRLRAANASPLQATRP